MYIRALGTLWTCCWRAATHGSGNRCYPLSYEGEGIGYRCDQRAQESSWIEGVHRGLFKKGAPGGPTPKGPDYLIGAAEQMKAAGGAMTASPRANEVIRAEVDAFQNAVIDRVMNGDETGTLPGLTPREMTAMTV
jgi:hypothetical protein